jgi:hypothetical protein
MGYSDAPQVHSTEANMLTLARFPGSIRDI